MMQIGTQAAQGKLPAAREFFQLVDRSEQAIRAESHPEAVAETDRFVMESILRRMQNTKSEPVDVSAESSEVSK